jgi:HK97 family phage prohead protease
MSNKKEVRFVSEKTLEVRAVDGKRTMSGIAARYNVRSLDLGGFTEVLAPGAFTRTLTDPASDVCCLYGHNLGNGLLGRTTSGTLRLRSTDDGLAFDCDLPNTTLGNDTAESISRGDVTGMSFGFMVVNDDWATASDGTTVRTVKDLDLMEISAVPFPAYPSTSVQMRSLMFPGGLPDGLPAVNAVPDESETDKLLALVLDRRSR